MTRRNPIAILVKRAKIDKIAKVVKLNKMVKNNQKWSKWFENISLVKKIIVSSHSV